MFVENQLDITDKFYLFFITMYMYYETDNK